jgi:hypothetical protein
MHWSRGKVGKAYMSRAPIISDFLHQYRVSRSSAERLGQLVAQHARAPQDAMLPGILHVSDFVGFSGQVLR